MLSGDYMHKRIIATAILLAGLVAHQPVQAGTEIQMLPPIDFTPAGHVCNAGSATSTTYGVLFWDGVNPIRCIPGFTGDGGGNISIAGNANVADNANIGGNTTVGGFLFASGALRTDTGLIISGAQSMLTARHANTLIDLA